MQWNDCLWAGQLPFHSPMWQFLSSPPYLHLSLGPLSLLYNEYRCNGNVHCTISWVGLHIKQPKHEPGCLPPSITEIKKGWSYTPTCGPGKLPFIFRDTIPHIGHLWKLFGHAMAQVVVTGIPGQTMWNRGCTKCHRVGTPPSTSVFRCHYHSNNNPLSFVHSFFYRQIYNLSNWQFHKITPLRVTWILVILSPCMISDKPSPSLTGYGEDKNLHFKWKQWEDETSTLLPIIRWHYEKSL